jgi:hypothetical protein
MPGCSSVREDTQSRVAADDSTWASRRTLSDMRNPAYAARVPFAVVGAACYGVWLALPHLLSPFLPGAAKEPRTYREELVDAYRQLARSDDPFTTWVLVAAAGLVITLAFVIAHYR